MAFDAPETVRQTPSAEVYARTSRSPASLSPENRVAQTLYLNSENPALRKLSLRSAEFRQALGTAAEWGSVSRAAAEWVRALIAYDRSPLNLNDPELEKLRRQSRALTRMSHR